MNPVNLPADAGPIIVMPVVKEQTTDSPRSLRVQVEVQTLSPGDTLRFTISPTTVKAFILALESVDEQCEAILAAWGAPEVTSE